MVLAVMDELDAMADRFGVPKLRGAKTYTRDINTAGAMGDGVLMLNPSWINTYAAATKGGNLEDYAQGLLKKRNDIIAAQRKITNEMSELRPYSVTWNAKSKEFDKLRKELKEVTDDANVALHVKKKEGSLPKRGTVPQGGDQYFTEAFDKFRQLMFHEFGHHVHQTYKKTGRRAVMRPVLERRLIDLWAKDAKGLKERSLSVYGRTNQHEWFAENFASYFMGRRDLVAKEFIEMIEEALNDIA